MTMIWRIIHFKFFRFVYIFMTALFKRKADAYGIITSCGLHQFITLKISYLQISSNNKLVYISMVSYVGNWVLSWKYYEKFYFCSHIGLQYDNKIFLFIYQSDFFPNFIIIFQFYHLISSHNILYLLNMLSYGLNRLGREFIINLRPYMVRNLRLRQGPPFYPYYHHQIF